MFYSVKRGLDDNQRSVEVPSDRLRSALGVSGPRFRVFNHKEWWEGVVCTYQRTPSKARTIPFRFHVCIQRGFQFFVAARGRPGRTRALRFLVAVNGDARRRREKSEAKNPGENEQQRAEARAEDS